MTADIGRTPENEDRTVRFDPAEIAMVDPSIGLVSDIAFDTAHEGAGLAGRAGAPVGAKSGNLDARHHMAGITRPRQGFVCASLGDQTDFRAAVAIAHVLAQV